MPKFIRLFEKKRGQRRTGSPWLGRLTEAFFFALLVLLAIIGLSAITFNHFTGIQRIEQTIGFGFWLTVIVLSSFVVIGTGGFLWTIVQLGVSRERRSALATKASALRIVHEAVPMPVDYPCLPTDANLTNSPGTTLAFRLPSVESPLLSVLTTTGFIVVWNAIGMVLLIAAIEAHSKGRPEWFLDALLGPIWLVGIWSSIRLGWAAMSRYGIGPTIVEISDHPLFPGGRYGLSLTQAGQLRIRTIEVFLVCEEEVSFHQGTDVRTESKAIYKSQLGRITNFRIQAGLPFERRFEFSIPVDAMHSFQSQHNAVQWKFVVQGVAEGWSPFQFNLQRSFLRSFPILVYPGHALPKVSPPTKHFSLEKTAQRVSATRKANV